MPTDILNIKTQIQICMLKGTLQSHYCLSIIIIYSFHNKLKSNPRYLNHNVNRRCDDLIEVLLSMEVDMFFARKRKEVMSNVADASKKVEGDRHRLAQSIANSHIQVIQRAL